MAPERVLSLIVMDLRLENSGLKCNIKYFEPGRSDEKLRVRWAVQSQPEGFLPVGGGVAYVLDTGRVKEYPPSEDAFPQKSSDGSYFWDEGDIRPEPSLMQQIQQMLCVCASVRNCGRSSKSCNWQSNETGSGWTWYRVTKKLNLSCLVCEPRI